MKTDIRNASSMTFGTSSFQKFRRTNFTLKMRNTKYQCPIPSTVSSRRKRIRSRITPTQTMNKTILTAPNQGKNTLEKPELEKLRNEMTAFRTDLKMKK